MDKKKVAEILNNNFKTGKLYFILVDKDDGEKVTVNRLSRGFNPHELLGFLEWVQMEIMEQMKGTIKPDIIERTYIKEK